MKKWMKVALVAVTLAVAGTAVASPMVGGHNVARYGGNGGGGKG